MTTKRGRVIDYTGEEEEEDMRNILADGETLRVSMRFADSVGQNAPQGISRMIRDGMVMHRPGFVQVNDTAARDAKQAAYDDYEADLHAALRSTNQGAQPGDVCTVRNEFFPNDFGAPGHLVDMDGQLVCKPDRPRGTAATPGSNPTGDRAMHAQIMDVAYSQYEDEMKNAWRSK